MTDQKLLHVMRNVDRQNVEGVRKTLSMLGATVAEVDEQLRYVWVDNPHPDFDARSVVGKRDDELMSKADAEELTQVKKEVFNRQEPVWRVLSFERSNGVCHYSLFAFPICRGSRKAKAILTVGFSMPPVKGK